MNCIAEKVKWIYQRRKKSTNRRQLQKMCLECRECNLKTQGLKTNLIDKCKSLLIEAHATTHQMHRQNTKSSQSSRMSLTYRECSSTSHN